MNVRLYKRAWYYIKVRLSEFFTLGFHYSFSYSFWGLVWWFCFYLRPSFAWELSKLALLQKTKWLDKYIDSHYADIINSFNVSPPQTILADNYYIWVFWGQGKEAMPDIVKAYYRQLTYFNKNVILITNDNVKNYISLPAAIYEKVNQGKITWTHFSDIVRTTLLAHYGGLWLDATVWVSGSIPFEKFKSLEIYSANSIEQPKPNSICYWGTFDGNWSTWCLGTIYTNHLLFAFVSKMIQAIAIKEKYWLDYVLQDYLIYRAYRLFPSVKSAIDTINIHNPNRYLLVELMDKPFDEATYYKMIENDFVFKMRYRTPWKKSTTQGELTLYGRILQGIIKPKDDE